MAEPEFIAVPTNDPDRKSAFIQARATLSYFEQQLRQIAATQAHSACIKTLLVDGEKQAHMWLTLRKIEAQSYIVEVFEIPPQFTNFPVGTLIRVPKEDVEDWMINANGHLYGGFSLRHQRMHLPPEKQHWFDPHVGVEVSEPLPEA
jgi:uncharacterized protein YegJ (DUF2314 family)